MMRKAISRFVKPSHRLGGARPVHIYALRLVYGLMFFVLGKQTWTHILQHHEPWDPTDAVAWSLWAAFASLAGLGLLRPLEMIPILLLEIFYKLLWLCLVAFPLWMSGKLADSPAASTAAAFAWVFLPMLAVPWGYTFRQYIRPATQSRFGGQLC